MKNGKQWFWTTTSIYILLALANGLLTYIAIPDLVLDGNLLVKYLGLGWMDVFMVNVIIIGLCTINSYYTFIKYKPLPIQCKNFKEYFSMLYFERPDKFKWIYYRFPKNWKPVFATIGFTFAITLPVSQAFLVLEWIIHLTNPMLDNAYNEFESLFPLDRFDVAIAMILYIILIFYWNIREYRINKKRIWEDKQEMEYIFQIETRNL